jgi:hypothetical protein
LASPTACQTPGSNHTVSLLVWQGPERQQLYCRIEDRDAGIVYCTFQLGALVAESRPETQFDAANNLYVLNYVGPKSYVLYKINVNGEFLGSTNYAATKSRPTLRRLADGTLQIVGGHREIAPSLQPARHPNSPTARPACPVVRWFQLGRNAAILAFQ